MKRKILFIASIYPNRSPAQRYRFEQYFRYLEANGYQCDFSWLLEPDDFKTFYSPGNYFGKLRILLKSLWIRLRDLWRVSRYDVVFVQREALMVGTALFERLFALRSRLVFDFDDAIWLPNISEGNRALAFLKRPQKTNVILKAAHMVFAGNAYLEDYARKWNPNVKRVPTTIDLDFYRYEGPRGGKDGKVCIGWTGSPTTLPHFLTALPALIRIRQLYGDKIYYKLIGVPEEPVPGLDALSIPWNGNTEAADLAEMDIGIMPLPDNAWTRGKCACKGLQYMALNIPCVLSPVGVNADIVRHDENGLLAATDEEWVTQLSRLIESPELRRRLGDAGRITVESTFAAQVVWKDYVRYLDELLAKK